MPRLRRNDLALPAPVLAPRLIGARLQVGTTTAVICETEAYQGEADRACHAHRGRTPRTEVLYHEPGRLYCYLCYGIHILANVVCDRINEPAAVLLRGVRLPGVDPRRSNGPGKLTTLLAITRADNDSDCCAPGARIHLLAADNPVPPIDTGPRVGVAYAGTEWGNRPWRFWARGFPAVRQKSY